MITYVSAFVVICVIQVILAQVPTGPPFLNPKIPTECWRPPKIVENIYKCCPLPSVHSEEDLKACNIQNPSQNWKTQVTPWNHKVDCPRKLCLLRNKGILNPDDSIDYEKMKAFIDTWIENSTPFMEEGITIAKEKCFVNISEKQEVINARGFPICEPDRIFHCIVNSILWNCRLDEEIPTCSDLQRLMNTCRPFIYGQS